jgi:hypothetical protein
VVEARPTQRSKAAKAQKPAWSWDTALAELKRLRDEIEMLQRSRPVGGSILEGELAELVAILGYKLIAKGSDKDNA